MKSGLFSLTILAVFIGVPCQAGHSWEVDSISFPENHRPALRIGVISPELPEPEYEEMEEDPDSLPPHTS